MPTIEGSYDEGNREFTITTSASHPVVGEYKRYKVDGAAETIKNVTYAESGIARIGDFYCTKNNGTTGYLIPKEADETTVLKSSASFSRRTRAVSVQRKKRS